MFLLLRQKLLVKIKIISIDENNILWFKETAITIIYSHLLAIICIYLSFFGAYRLRK
jgi:hypothetical protein